MTCPSAIMRSMYADGALDGGAAHALEEHLRSCAACTSAVAALRTERAALRAALRTEDAAAPVPAFRPAGRDGTLLALGAAAAVVLAAVIAAWQLLSNIAPDAARWLVTPAWTLLADGLAVLVLEGIPMLSSTIDFTGTLVLLAFCAGVLALLLRRRSPAGIALSLAVLAAAMPPPSHAVEIRRGMPLVAVAPGETVDDTLMAFGETISVDGTVNGDLVAFGESVNIRGNVTGDVLTAAQTITIEGSVGGNVIGFARSIDTVQAQIARNLYGFGNEVSVGNGARVESNATLFGNEVTVRGTVGRDVLAFARSVAISGNVERHVEAFSGDVTLLPSARVGGNVTAHVEEERNLRSAPGAAVSGAAVTRTGAEQAEASKYATASFYLRQAVRLGAAFLTGLLLFWLFPSLLRAELWDARAALRAGGIGLVAAIGLPVAAIVVSLTIIGIPLGIAAAVIWLFGLYFAKIVVAQHIGAALFRSGGDLPHHAATLLAGLVIVIIAVNLPLIGGITNVLLTLVGLGLLVGRRFGGFDEPLRERMAA